jgi:zinc/manganese transport system permease protein
VAEARGLRPYRIELAFLVVLALATSMTVPVVGAFLMFSLMIAPAGTARSLTDSPLRALGLSVVLALAIVWASIVASYESNWPVGFYVGTIGFAAFVLGRGWQALRRGRVVPRLAV